jgi:hypothetical protein
MELENFGEARSRVNCRHCGCDIAILFALSPDYVGKKALHTILLSPKITEETKSLKRT